jgi:hypothetical protein
MYCYLSFTQFSLFLVSWINSVFLAAKQDPVLLAHASTRGISSSWNLCTVACRIGVRFFARSDFLRTNYPAALGICSRRPNSGILLMRHSFAPHSCAAPPHSGCSTISLMNRKQKPRLTSTAHLFTHLDGSIDYSTLNLNMAPSCLSWVHLLWEHTPPCFGCVPMLTSPTNFHRTPTLVVCLCLLNTK